MSSQQTREVVERYFTDLERGDLASALSALSAGIDFELPVDKWNEVIPYLGKHVGIEAVQQAFAVRGETTEILDYALRDLRVDGNTAFAIIYTRAAHTRTKVEFEIEDTHTLVVEDGKIVSWKVYFDPNGEIAAFTADQDERLIAASRQSDRELVKELLRFGANVNHRDPVSGLTPLLIAAGRADADVVRQLIAAGADVLAVDRHGGASALHKAVQGGGLAAVVALVEAGAFVDAVAPTTGHTPLMDAVWFKYPDIAKYLLDRGAGVNLSTHYGFSLQQHFEYELNVNTRGKEKILLAHEYIQQRQADDQRRAMGHALMTAATAGDVAEVRRLIAAGVDVDERFPIVNGFNDAHTPLLVAARDGHAEIARLLLEAGADVNATEPTFGAVPLHKSVYNGHLELTELIARWPGVDLNFQGATNGYTPLHDALWHGLEECSRVVIDAGAALDLVGHDGKTPLELATEELGAQHPLTELIRAKRG